MKKLINRLVKKLSTLLQAGRKIKVKKRVKKEWMKRKEVRHEKD